MDPQLTSTRRTLQTLGLVAGPVLALGAWIVLPDSFRSVAGETVTFSAAGRATMALMLWMSAWWLTEAIDIEATALLPLVLLPLMGAATFKKAAASYGDEFIFLFMGGFILALSMQRWGLDRRIALVTLRIVGSGPRAMILGFMLATGAISCFVSNTATAAMMMPVGLSVIDVLLKRKPDGASHDTADTSSRNFALCLMLGIAYASSIGGVGTIIGTPPNVFLVGYLREGIDPAYRHEITFVRWLSFGLPMVAVFLPITWMLLTYVLYPVRMRRLEGGREFIDRELRAMGPMNRGEWITFLVFMFASALWISRPWISKWTIGEGDAALQPLRFLTDATIAMLAAMLLFITPVNWKQRVFTMNWEHARRLPWGILILFGGGLSLAAAIEANGVAEFIGGQTQRFAGVPELLLVIIVVTAVVFFSEIASNTATATTLIPIFAAMAPGLGVHPYMLVIPAGLAASLAFMLPVGTPPNAIVFGTGHVTMPQMVKAGFLLNLIGIVLITLLTYIVIKPMLIG